jgi:hypothetical protein
MIDEPQTDAALTRRMWWVRNILVGLIALMTTFVILRVSAHAQQPTVITLLPRERALVAAAPMPAKDVVAHVAERMEPARGPRMVTVQSCPGVPADSVQALRRDLQQRQVVVIVELADPDPRVCAR